MVAVLLDMDYLEVEALLRSAGSGGTPPGWRKFSPASKRRTLRQSVERLPREQVNELARDLVEHDDDGEEPVAPAPSPARIAPAWRPIYAVPEDPAEKYGLRGTTAKKRADGDASQPSKPAVSGVEPDASIFVVHGRDTATESQTQLLVERTTGRTTVVLHEQVTGGRTVIEQIERHGSSAGYAIILLTGDDEGGLRGGEMRPRARQNVVLELGYFWGLLGRNRVAVLVEDGVELPSDVGGIHYIAIDAGGGWKTKLVLELQDAGFDVDWNKFRM